jgi:Fic family protein
MKVEDFTKSHSGKLIRATLIREATRGGSERVEYCSFIPSPLPPQLHMNTEIVVALSHASHALGELKGRGANLPNPHLLTNPFVRREAVLSSRIEGTEANIRDVYEYEAAQRARKPARMPEVPGDVREVINYIRALSYGLDFLDERPISLQFIREMHELLMQGVRGKDKQPGQFRDEQVWIGERDCLVEDARFVPAPPHEVLPLMEMLENYIQQEGDSVPSLVRLAYIHYQFETIHPFMDGNGRIGRLLMSLLLIREGLLSEPLLYLSAFFEANREQYYRHLYTVSQRGAWEEWVGFFLRGVAEQANDGLVRAKRLLDLQDKWRNEVPKLGSSGNLVRLVESLFDSPVLTVRDAEAMLGVTYNAARNNVRLLVDAGMLHEIEATYPRLYIAMPIVNAVERPVSDAELS